MNPAEEITESNGSSSSSSSSSASSNNNTSISNDSSNPSTDVNNDINNEVNDSNDNDIRFEEDAALKDFFSSDSKITAFRSTGCFHSFPRSRKLADDLNRTLRYIDKLVRNMKGKNALDVAAPLQIDDNLILMFI